MSDEIDESRKANESGTAGDSADPADPKKTKEPQKPYAIGRGKPPTETRFKPGQCGNPKGRPRGAKNTSTVLNDELNARITVTEDGRRKKITKREAMVKRVVNNAVAGEHKSALVVFSEERARAAKSAGASNDEALQRPQDTATVEGILARMRAAFDQERVDKISGEALSASTPETPGGDPVRANADAGPERIEADDPSNPTTRSTGPGEET